MRARSKFRRNSLREVILGDFIGFRISLEGGLCRGLCRGVFLGLRRGILGV